jgi:glycosyltransferase involved in cell wall biosynthesis
MKISVLLSAHTNAAALHWALLSYRVQTVLPYEIIVAQDSDTSPVAETVAQARGDCPYPIILQQQSNQGFRKCLAMNKAIAASTGDYLVFSDSDCIARNDIVAAYARYAKAGQFLSGGSHINLPQSFHQEHLTDELVRSQAVFGYEYLRSIGARVERLRLVREPSAQWLLNTLTARNAFTGAHSGAWRADVMRVAGFDETMAYGAEDRNLGIRLNAIGVSGRRIRHSLAWLHLDHPRSYAHGQTIESNKAWNKVVRHNGAHLPRASILLA